MSGYSEFIEKIIFVIRMVPYGKVVSYGQVAVYVGAPRAARQVGGTLRRLEGVDLPWWRVLNNEGRITIKGNWHNDRNIQRKLLEAEGVVFSDEFVLDMRKYRFIADTLLLEKLRLPQDYITLIRGKYKF
jgi:methylated-DNA-protein-cysteine methyltransferase-like protein